MLLAAAHGAAEAAERKAAASPYKRSGERHRTKKRVSFKERPQVHHLSPCLMAQIPTLRVPTVQPSSQTTSTCPDGQTPKRFTVMAIPQIHKVKSAPSVGSSPQTPSLRGFIVPQAGAVSFSAYSIPQAPLPQTPAPISGGPRPLARHLDGHS
jgi:hypothetical protein